MSSMASGQHWSDGLPPIDFKASHHRQHLKHRQHLPGMDRMMELKASPERKTIKHRDGMGWFIKRKTGWWMLVVYLPPLNNMSSSIPVIIYWFHIIIYFPIESMGRIMFQTTNQKHMGHPLETLQSLETNFNPEVLRSWIDDHCSNPSTRLEENPAAWHYSNLEVLLKETAIHRRKKKVN